VFFQLNYSVVIISICFNDNCSNVLTVISVYNTTVHVYNVEYEMSKGGYSYIHNINLHTELSFY